MVANQRVNISFLWMMLSQQAISGLIIDYIKLKIVIKKKTYGTTYQKGVCLFFT